MALGGQPIELVLASDIDVRFLQATLEPRYVLRVFERLVLRIKELDAVCVRHDRSAPLDPEIIARRARSMTGRLPALLERAGFPLPSGPLSANTHTSRRWSAPPPPIPSTSCRC